MWGRVAQATGGMLLNPLSRSPDLLSEGMLSIVRALLSRLVLGQPEFEADSLEGFQLLDVSGLPPAETEEVRGWARSACVKSLNLHEHLGYWTLDTAEKSRSSNRVQGAELPRNVQRMKSRVSGAQSGS